MAVCKFIMDILNYNYTSIGDNKVFSSFTYNYCVSNRLTVRKFLKA